MRSRIRAMDSAVYRRVRNAPAAGDEPPAYTGPLDLVPGAVVAYSLRAMSAAWVGNAIRLREDGGDTEANFTTAVGNAIDTAEVTAFLNGAGGHGSVWYDQSGNGYNCLASSDFPGDQPVWSLSVVGGKPGFVVIPETSGEFRTAETNISLPNGACTVFMVCRGTVETRLGGASMSFFGGSTAVNTLNDGTHLAAYDYAGLVDDAAVYLVDSAWEFGTNDYKVNGTSLVGTDFDTAAVDPITGYICVALNLTSVSVVEVLVYSTLLSSANRLAIRQNIATYYGITLP